MVPDLANSDAWQGAHLLTGDAAKRMWLLDDELRSAQIALTDFYVARLGIERRAGREAWARLAYSTKGFITAVRRFANLLESMVATGREFPLATRERIKLTWRKKKPFFDVYTSARDAVEHIHGDVATTNQFMNWHSSGEAVTAAVTPDGTAEISEAALKKLVECRDEILTGLQLDYLIGSSKERLLGEARAGFLWVAMARATAPEPR